MGITMHVHPTMGILASSTYWLAGSLVPANFALFPDCVYPLQSGGLIPNHCMISAALFQHSLVELNFCRKGESFTHVARKFQNNLLSSQSRLGLYQSHFRFSNWDLILTWLLQRPGHSLAPIHWSFISPDQLVLLLLNQNLILKFDFQVCLPWFVIAEKVYLCYYCLISFFTHCHEAMSFLTISICPMTSLPTNFSSFVSPHFTMSQVSYYWCFHRWKEIYVISLQSCCFYDILAIT